MLDSQTTTALLQKIGLSRNEVKCYLASLALGPATVREIATRAGVNRVNAYSAVKALGEKGLVKLVEGAGGRRVLPASVETLKDVALDHQKRATKVRWKIEEMVPQLAAASAAAQRSPDLDLDEVLIFRGEDAFYKIADRTLAVPHGSEICLIENFDYFDVPPDNPKYDQDYYIPTRIARGIRARILRRPGTNAVDHIRRDPKELRETRILPREFAFPCSIYIYGDEVALLWVKNQVHALVVRGGPVVDLMQVVFEMTWKRSGESLTKINRPRKIN